MFISFCTQSFILLIITRYIEVLRPDWSQDQTVGLSLEGLVLFNITVHQCVVVMMRLRQFMVKTGH